MRRHFVSVFLLTLALTISGSLVANAQGTKGGEDPQQAGEPPAVTIDNDYIRVSADDDGQFVIGTTGGDPGLPTDDNKRLLYGYPDEIWSSFATVRVIVDGQTRDIRLLDQVPVEGPIRQGNAIITTWLVDGIRVTQRLELAFNVYTNREDTIRIQYTLTNTAGTSHAAGVRSMLDIAIGRVGPVVEGDGAPYFVPGAGNLTHEAEFTGNIPAIWKAFESLTFDPASTKGQGILVGPGATPPDRLVLARWGRFEQEDGIRFHPWDYTVNPAAGLTLDSAVAMYWNPRDLAPGASRTVTTFYGLAGPGGGQAWIDAPVTLQCPDLTFSATHWVANTGDEPFTGGSSTITLPGELEIVDGPATQSLGAIEPGAARSATWILRPLSDAQGDFSYSVASEFETGSEPLTAESSVHVPVCTTPTPPTPTPTRVVTPAGPTPTPVPPAEVPEANTLILLASGLGALAGYAQLRRRARGSEDGAAK
ncbi:MAG: hypothetical protein MAG451_02683 [Anaerolineales bacterium]|nr:hypothetical protein [Anaerolineales bacterium]